MAKIKAEAELERPLTRAPVVWLDATPDADYPLRLLRAHRESHTVRWAQAIDGDEASARAVERIEQDQNDRVRYLDEAIRVLETHYLSRGC